MPIGLKLVTGPAVEPVSLAEAKQRLRVTVSSEDTDVTALVAECRAAVERGCNRALITQTWSLFLDAFPGSPVPYDPLHRGWLYGRDGSYDGHGLLGWPGVLSGIGEILIPLPPLQSVTWIKYYDADGAQQTLDPSAYQVGIAAEPGRVRPVWGTTWPVTQFGRPEAVEVRFVAGYGDTAADVPSEAKAAIKILLAGWHSNQDGGVNDLPAAVGRLLHTLSYGEVG